MIPPFLSRSGTLRPDPSRVTVPIVAPNRAVPPNIPPYPTVPLAPFTHVPPERVRASGLPRSLLPSSLTGVTVRFSHEPSAETLERLAAQSLGKYIGNLLLRVDMLQLHCLSLNVVT